VYLFVVSINETNHDNSGSCRDIRDRRKTSAGSEKLDVPDRSGRSKSPGPESNSRQRNRSRSPAPDRGQRSRSPGSDSKRSHTRSRSPCVERGQRSLSPTSDRGHTRSRSPAPRHHVPDSVSRSMSPDLRLVTNYYTFTLIQT